VRVGVVTFPGSLDDGDARRAVRIAGGDAVPLWHADPDLRGVEAVVLPGGFSYGDYLRCGAIARFAPVMASIVDAARAGLPVLGICNGFQVLCEAHLLPGALVRNAHLHFRNRDQRLVITSVNSPWAAGYAPGQEVVIPVKNGEGRYVADQRTLDALEAEGRVVARYSGGNPNGSMRDIAAIRNETGNVLGIMPHPEHAISTLTGPSADGLGFFASIIRAADAARAAYLAGAGT
jgi:phosphoribosylformylglycinamidine synthase subunit PurQ / glutaminase